MISLIRSNWGGIKILKELHLLLQPILNLFKKMLNRILLLMTLSIKFINKRKKKIFINYNLIFRMIFQEFMYSMIKSFCFKMIVITKVIISKIIIAKIIIKNIIIKEMNLCHQIKIQNQPKLLHQ